MILDLGAILSGLGSIIAAVAGIGALRSAREAKRQLTTNNGGSTVKDANDRQERALARLLAVQESQGELIRSLGHQMGEVRTDLAQTNTRLTSVEGDVRRGRPRLSPAKRV